MMCVVSCWYLPELGRVLVRSRGVVMGLETLPRVPNAARWSHFRRAWQIQRDQGGRRWDPGPKGRIRSGGGGAGGWVQPAGTVAGTPRAPRLLNLDPRRSWVKSWC